MAYCTRMSGRANPPKLRSQRPPTVNSWASITMSGAKPNSRPSACPLWRALQRVVAVDVEAIVGNAAEGFGAIGVGARHDDDSQPPEQRCQVTARQTIGDHQRGLPAGRLVAVLQADDQDGGA